MNRKPTILYYDNGQEDKRRLLEKSINRMGFSLMPVTPAHFQQTVGYLAKVKGFPMKKISPLEVLPGISQEVMVLCYFSEENLDTLLAAMKKRQNSPGSTESHPDCPKQFLDVYPAFSGIN